MGEGMGERPKQKNSNESTIQSFEQPVALCDTGDVSEER